MSGHPYSYKTPNRHSTQSSIGSDFAAWPDTPSSSKPPSEQSTPSTSSNHVRRTSRVRFDANANGGAWNEGKSASTNASRQAYRRDRVREENHSSIDWSHEYAKERIRKQVLNEQMGLKGIIARLWDATIPWIVVVATGLATGLVASCLDILSAWLSDLRLGKCRDAWWLSESVCCTGLDPNEPCNAWRTWSQIVGGNEENRNIVIKAVTQYSVYMVLAVTFAVLSSYFVQVYAPYAFHTGIPEIKTILGGYILKGFLSPMVLIVKSLGLPLAVASGLQLGKEGPLVHVSCCIGEMMLKPFNVLRQNEARVREILSAAAAAGVSVAFGAPLGGVLFSLEEISTFFPGSTLWQSFVCAVVAAITLQYIDPFNTGKLVLFQVTTSQVWRGFELIPWLCLGVFGGLWGACFIRMNEEWERMRRSTGLNKWPVTEVAALALFTAVVSYLVILMRIPNAELVANLFQDCSATDTYGLCDTSNTFILVFLLLVTAFSKTLLTAVTFGASIPAGVFLPSLTIGACVGRAVGIVMASIHRARPTAWLFTNCPADGECISPPVYAVIGAASCLGGVTRMTISLVVILFELTGAIDLVLQLMMAVMVAKFTGDFFSKDGIYETWINLRNYPFLNNKVEYRKDTVLAKDVMTPVKDIVYISDEGMTVDQISSMLSREGYRGFPIVRTMEDRIVIGHMSRLELTAAIEKIQLDPSIKGETPCFFLAKPTSKGRQIGPNAPTEENLKSEDGGDDESTEDAVWISLGNWVDEIPIMLNQDIPMEVVVQMFQRLGLRSVLFTRQGALQGILTKMDLHGHIHPTPHISDREPSWRSPLNSLSARSRLSRIDENAALQEAITLRRDLD